jgi:hypothetical protein
MYGSSAIRGLIPKSTGGRVSLGLGAGALGGGIMAMRSRRSNQSLGMSKQVTPQKQYEWQIEGGATDAQAKSYVSSIHPGVDTSGLRM